jgi:ABC-type amino acid transport substrate-binding protein
LHFNRIDLAATDELVGWALINKLYPQDIAQFAVVDKPFATQYLHLMVSRNYPNAAALTEKFNATFKSLQEKNALPLF